MKRCPACNEEKSLDAFANDSRRKDGRRIYCRVCSSAQNKAWRDANIEKARSIEKQWRDANKAAIYAKGKRWREANPDRARETAYRWRDANPEKVAATLREQNRKRWMRVEFRIRKRIAEGIRLALKGHKTSRTFELLGITFEEFKRHLERQFTPGMTWANFGKWHIDHILPLSSFKIESAHDEAFKAAWSPANLRPLWAKDNLRKHAKLTHLI